MNRQVFTNIIVYYPENLFINYYEHYPGITSKGKILTRNLSGNGINMNKGHENQFNRKGADIEKKTLIVWPTSN